MKEIILFGTMILACQLQSQAQRLLLEAQIENTVAGWQSGATVLVATRSQWAVGGFHQVGFSVRSDVGSQSSFSGLQIQMPLVKTTKLSLFANLRGGFANEKFLVVVPGLETRVELGKRVGVACGMSIRMGFPALSSRLIFKLF